MLWSARADSRSRLSHMSISVREGVPGTVMPSPILESEEHGGRGQSGFAIANDVTGTFSPVGAMSKPRYGHGATLLGDGSVLVTGGENNNSGVILADAQIFNPTTNAFSAVGAMTTPRTLHTAARLPDGTVLVTGGYGSSGVQASAEIYNPTLGSFAGIGNMNSPRYQHAATLYRNAWKHAL